VAGRGESPFALTPHDQLRVPWWARIRTKCMRGCAEIRNCKLDMLIAIGAIGVAVALFSSLVLNEAIEMLTEGSQLVGRPHRILAFVALTIGIHLMTGCVALSVSVAKRGALSAPIRVSYFGGEHPDFGAPSTLVANRYKLRPRARSPRRTSDPTPESRVLSLEAR